MDAKQEVSCSYTLTREKESLRNLVNEQASKQTARRGSQLCRHIYDIRDLH